MFNFRPLAKLLTGTSEHLLTVANVDHFYPPSDERAVDELQQILAFSLHSKRRLMPVKVNPF